MQIPDFPCGQQSQEAKEDDRLFPMIIHGYP